MRRVLTVSIIALAVLVSGCSGGSSDGSTTTTVRPTPSTESDDLTSIPRIARFCEDADELLTKVATLSIESVEALRDGVAEAVRLLEEMEENSPERLDEQVTALKAAATRMQDAIEATDDLGEAQVEVAALQTPTILEASRRINVFLETKCGK